MSTKLLICPTRFNKVKSVKWVAYGVPWRINSSGLTSEIMLGNGNTIGVAWWRKTHYFYYGLNNDRKWRHCLSYDVPLLLRLEMKKFMPYTAKVKPDPRVSDLLADLGREAADSNEYDALHDAMIEAGFSNEIAKTVMLSSPPTSSYLWQSIAGCLARRDFPWDVLPPKVVKPPKKIIDKDGYEVEFFE